MSEVLDYDGEASRELEAIYITPDVVEQRQAVLNALQLQQRREVNGWWKIRPWFRTPHFYLSDRLGEAWPVYSNLNPKVPWENLNSE